MPVQVHTVISHCKTLLEITSGVPVPALKSAFQIAAKILEEFEVAFRIALYYYHFIVLSLFYVLPEAPKFERIMFDSR
jgi:hypothetical protein